MALPGAAWHPVSSRPDLMTDCPTPPLAALARAPRRGAGAARGRSAAQPAVAVPDAARALFVAALAGVTTRRPLARRGADRRRGRAPRPRPRRSSSARERGRALPGVGDAAVRAGVAVARDDGPAPARDVAAAAGGEHAARGRGRAGARARAAARPARRGGRAGRRAARATRSTATSSSSRLVAGGLPARVPGRGARRGRGARLDRRRVPVDRRPSRAHRPLGRRGRPALGVLGRRPALHARRRRGVDLPGARAAPDRRGARARAPSCSRTQPWGREQWERLAEGQTFDGMESWLPWLAEREHLLPDLLPDDALVLLVEPKRMRDRAQELLDEEAALAATLAATWGATAERELPAPLARRSTGCSRTRRPARCRCWRRPRRPTRRARGDRVRPRRRRRRRARAPPARARAATGYRVVLAAEGTGSAQRLHDVLAGEGVDAADGEPRPARCGSSSRRSTAASCCPGAQLALVAEADLTGRRRVHRRARGARRGHRLLRRARARRLRRALPCTASAATSG